MPALDGIAELEGKLNAERARLLQAVAGLAVERLEQSAGDGWSIRDILAHVAMAEGVNVRFARRMVEKDNPAQLLELAGEYPDFPGEFDLDRFNAWMTARWRTRSLPEIFAALQETRAGTLAWLGTLSPEQLERRGRHAAWGDLTVRDLVRVLLIHDKRHRADIEKCKRS